MLSAGLMLICHGPWLLPAVCAASLSPTSLFLSSTYRLCPVFHCFQTKQRSRRLIHWSRAPVKYSPKRPFFQAWRLKTLGLSSRNRILDRRSRRWSTVEVSLKANSLSILSDRWLVLRSPLSG